jgi:septal ring factor EnvC (AmiA/AmiB activator)
VPPASGPLSAPALAGALALALLLAPATSVVAQQKSARSEPRAAAPPPAARAAPAPTRSDTAAARRQRELRAEQQRLQGALARSKRQLAAAEASHSEATDALRASEAAISAANRRLRELARNRQQVERQIAALQQRSRAVAARHDARQQELGQILRVQFAAAQQPAWMRLLDGESPQQQGKDLAYLGYLAKASSRSVGELRERGEELAALEAQSRASIDELAAIAKAEDGSRKQLLQQQAARRQTLERLARQIETQRQSIATQERDDRRLASLLNELARVLAEQQRRERAAARSRSESARPSPPRPADAAGAAERAPAEAPPAQLRGRMTLPVQGELGARFGSPRRTEAGVNAPTWKGVFIRAPIGAPVRAVAAGQVVFADWLRGFGNLLVIDHGEGFLSVYGNNESLLAQVGERVAADEVIAEVGNTGGNAEPGLYFEMRLQGRPVDPLRWAAAR